MSPHTAFVPTSVSATRLSATSLNATLAPRSLPPLFSHNPQSATLRRAHITTTPPSAPAPARSPSRVLLWLHTDLRVHDNPALNAAASAAAIPGGALVPVASAASLDATATPLLAELSGALRELGSDLLAASGRPEQILLDICRRLKLSAVYFNRSVLRSRVKVEQRVTDALSRAGIHVEAFWGNVLRTPEDAALRREICPGLCDVARDLRRQTIGDPIAAPDRLPGLPRAAMRLPGVRAVSPKLGGGTSAAARILQRMHKDEETLLLSKRPEIAVALKVFLDYGAVSPKMVAQRAVKIMRSATGRTFSELVWRDYVCLAAHRAVGIRTAATRVAV